MQRPLAFCICFLLAAGCARNSSPTPSIPTVPESQPATALRSVQAAAIPTTYTIVDLGANVNPEAINEKNWVVGNVNGSEAFLYRNRFLRLMGPLPGDVQVGASGINDLGTIIGNVDRSSPEPSRNGRALQFRRSCQITRNRFRNRQRRHRCEQRGHAAR